MIADTHPWLKHAIVEVFVGASSKRCRVNYMRNIFAGLPKGNSEVVSATIRTILAQPNAAHVAEQVQVITSRIGRQLSKVAARMLEAKEVLLAFTALPQAHWKQI